jgi:hypothetical protein
MNWKPGKEYKTRDGRKARIYAVDCGGEYPIHGAIEYENRWSAEGWAANGKVYSDDSNLDEIDLMPPLEECWVNIFELDFRRYYPTEEKAKAASPVDALRVAVHFREVVE